MAYCYREGRKRVFCTRATIGKDETTGQEWVHSQLTDSFVPCRLLWSDELRESLFGAGSWKQMCLSSPLRDVKSNLMIEEEYTEHRYSGTVTSETTGDAFLEALADTTVVDEGEHRRSRRRSYM